MKKIYKLTLLTIGLVITICCTDLEEKALDGVIASGSPLKADMQGITQSFADMNNGQNRITGFDEMTTDSHAGPTRGSDWDDNATLRQLHAHTWGAEHAWIKDFYNIIMTGVFKCDVVLSKSAQSSDHAAAKFFKSLFIYHMVDKFGGMPYRDDYTDLLKVPAFYDRSEAFTEGTKLATEALAALPVKTAGSAHIVSKDAANFLLAKYHLNKHIFTGAGTAAAADMTKVIDYVGDLTSTLNTTGTTAGDKYWLNFATNNDTSNELVFSIQRIRGDGTFGGLRYHWRMGTHYNQTPDGWNGPVIMGEYYDLFQENGVPEYPATGHDPRATYTTPNIVSHFGNPVGIQRGQMYKPGGLVKLQDRKENDLIYTKSVELVVDAATVETAGFRPMKYIPDNEDLDDQENDYAIFRYSDALLMAAEAKLRGGTGADAQANLDAVRSRVGLASITANLDNIYKERARELWLEGWRRNDMIRFGKFLQAKELKPSVSDEKYLLFPFPVDALQNASITQNPGY